MTDTVLMVGRAAGPPNTQTYSAAEGICQFHHLFTGLYTHARLFTGYLRQPVRPACGLNNAAPAKTFCPCKRFKMRLSHLSGKWMDMIISAISLASAEWDADGRFERRERLSELTKEITCGAILNSARDLQVNHIDETFTKGAPHQHQV